MTLSVFMLIFLAFLSTGEQENNKKQNREQELGNVLIKQNKAPGVLQEESLSVQKTGQSQADYLSDFLSIAPSITVQANERGEQVFSTRGFSERQIALTLDGMPIYAPYDGKINIGQIPIMFFSKLTLIKGGGGLFHGANGLGGGIELTTSDPFLFKRHSVFVWGEPVQAIGVSGKTGYAGLHFASVFNVGWRKSPGFKLPSSFKSNSIENGGERNNSDYLSFQIFNKTGIKISKKVSFLITSAAMWGKSGIPPAVYDFNPRYWRWTDSAMRFAKLDLLFSLKKTVKTVVSVYLINFSNTLDAFDDATYLTQQFPSSFTSKYLDFTIGGYAKVSAVFEKDMVRARFSVNDFIHNQTGSDNENPNFNSTLLTLSGDATTFRIKKTLIGAGFQASVEIPIDVSEQNNLFFHAGPQFNIGYTPNSLLKIAFLFAGRARFPTLKERFSGALGHRKPNYDLQPEKSYNFELNATVTPVSLIKLKTALFASNVSNLIELKSVGSGVEQLQNMDKVFLYGAEASATLDFFYGLKLNIGYQFLNYSSDKPLEYRSHHKVVTRFIYSPVSKLSFDLLGKFLSSALFFNPNSGKYETLDSHFVIDFFINYSPITYIKLTAGCRNLTDALFQTKYGFPFPGRTFFVGVQGRL